MPPPGAVPSVSLRRASASDHDFLVSLAASTRPELLQLGLNTAQLEGLVRMQLTAQERDYQNAYPDSEHSIVQRSARPVGRLWVARSAGEIRVLDISLLPEFRRSGIGTALYERLQAEAQSTRLPVRCSVFRFNQPSLAFHQSLGFQVTSRTEVMLELEWAPAALRAS